MTRSYAKACYMTDREYINLRVKILINQNFQCNGCKKDLFKYEKGSYELSHIVPDLRLTDESNCEILCPNCHAKKDPQRRVGGNY